MPPKRLLVVEDEAARRPMLRACLEKAGFLVNEAARGEEALNNIEADSFDIILLDLKTPGINGLEVMEKLSLSPRTPPTIIMTEPDSIGLALKARPLGVKHYLLKPLETDELLLKIEEILKVRDLAENKARRNERISRKFDFRELLGQSQAMIDLKELLALAARTEAAVLITGESGAGKKMAAGAIHKNSNRRAGRFVAINCAALSADQLEIELFGQEKGSFHGAGRTEIGGLEIAGGGTLFLDQIGELPLSTQARLYKALKDKTFERIGGQNAVKVDVRIVAAANRDLEEETKRGGFREDLYHHLNAVRIEMPSLRQRGAGDVVLTAEYLLEEASFRNRKNIKGFTPRAVKALIAAPWPGNVRELGRVMERVVKLARGDEIDLEDLPPAIQTWSPGARRKEIAEIGFAPGMTIKQAEAELIRLTLAETKGNRTKTAVILGITRQTLLNKIKEYGLV